VSVKHLGLSKNSNYEKWLKETYLPFSGGRLL
jgi:hypothetical protein